MDRVDRLGWDRIGSYKLNEMSWDRTRQDRYERQMPMDRIGLDQIWIKLDQIGLDWIRQISILDIFDVLDRLDRLER